MRKLFFWMLFLLASCGVFAQNHIQHTVVKDDTVTNLARKYSVTIHDIYKLNPEAKNGIKLGETLQIPVNEKNAKQQKKEGVYHKVEPKETFFGIAQKYGTTIQAIQDANKNILENGLQPDLQLLIPTGKKTESSTTIVKNDDIIHVVQPKETTFFLTQRYEVSEEELIARNPQLKEGLKAGDTIRISLNKKTENLFDEKQSTSEETSKSIDIANNKLNLTSLEKTMNNSKKKEVVIMLPLNSSRISNAQEAFKTNKFLNITVDFYSGALMAIDKIRANGGNFNITFYDSEETNSSTSSVEHIINTNDFSNVDVVIGPFFPSHSEKVASLLKSKGVKVISPMSKESKAIHENLYLAMPPSDVSKKVMLDYLKNKNQNTIAIVDKKKPSAKTFIEQNYQGVWFLGYNEKGGLDVESLKSLLQKGKTNYVILETESSSMVLNVTKILSGLQSTYDINLVALERTAAFESDEVSSASLAKLNLHYPSAVLDTSSDEMSSFYSEYRSKNNGFPSYPAVRGYDVVYDVLLRLSQDYDFEKVAKNASTEQSESKFSYVKSSDGGYYNAGVYILYYDNDLTIKEAK